jgi:hypothetical protein
MAVSFQLPSEIETTLRRQLANLDQAAKEALLVEMYHQNKLTHQQLANALGLSNSQTADFLKKHEQTNGKPAAAGELGDANGQKSASPQLTPAQRLAAWQTWVASMREWGERNLPAGHIIDDSRENIYQGRGE